MSIIELMRIFPDDATAEAEFARIRWSNGVECPRCGSSNVLTKTTHPTMPYRCRPCRRYFSVKTGTVMEASKFGYRVWAIASYLLTTRPKGISSIQLAKDLGITQKSAWHLAHRIREGWGGLNTEKMQGPVEVDETYIGGKFKNRKAHKRYYRGRGPMDKTPVVGIIDRATNSVRTMKTTSTTKETLQRFVRAHTTTIYTDEAGAYNGLPNHRAVIHSWRQYVKGDVHTNSIESHWALLKRGLLGTYHSVSRKHLQTLLQRVQR